MTRYQVLDTATGEVLHETDDRTKAARLAHRKALWAWEDKQSGNVPSRRPKARQRRDTYGIEAIVVLVGFLLLAMLWK